MRLNHIELELEWKKSRDPKYLREYVTGELSKEGEIVRWSINEVIKLEDQTFKVLKVSALIVNS